MGEGTREVRGSGALNPRNVGGWPVQTPDRLAEQARQDAISDRMRGMLGQVGPAVQVPKFTDEAYKGGFTNPPANIQEIIDRIQKDNPAAKNEVDPHGKNPHEKGAKLDAGKNRVGLMLSGFPRALEAVAEITTFGAKKYTPNGWKEVPDGINRYTDAMSRHLLKEMAGEVVDPDSELLHAAHLAWNALARLELMIKEKDSGA